MKGCKQKIPGLAEPNFPVRRRDVFNLLRPKQGEEAVTRDLSLLLSRLSWDQQLPWTNKKRPLSSE